MIIRGRVWKFGDDINTDILLPGAYMLAPVQEAAKQMFEAIRPGWSLRVESGDIILAGKNFGIGSGRPVPLSFKELGITCVVSEEMNSLFFRNCINVGFPVLDAPNVGDAFEEGDIAVIDFRSALITNERTGKTIMGDRLPEFVIQLIESGGTINRLRAEGYVRTRAR